MTVFRGTPARQVINVHDTINRPTQEECDRPQGYPLCRAEPSVFVDKFPIHLESGAEFGSPLHRLRKTNGRTGRLPHF
ncbi:hypothetical protein IAI60_21930 [Roseomonas sp. 1311]|uniref:Uncharacterized protein n=1 Tax=Roseomonas marmotae TaxID=2768161 RepID=A0ABS3KIF9_9PROT|nr:hypothetical protein [Roseomonas marmotae]